MINSNELHALTGEEWSTEYEPSYEDLDEFDYQPGTDHDLDDYTEVDLLS